VVSWKWLDRKERARARTYKGKVEDGGIKPPLQETTRPRIGHTTQVAISASKEE
jgi:hypothetical protein